jgi:CRP-like cAMP-binding protein
MTQTAVFAQKLSSFVDLSEEERLTVSEWCAQPRRMPKHAHFIREGDCPDAVCIMISGWAYRYKDLSNGRRQIVGFLLPGDMCDPQAFILRAADHGIAMLSDATVASVPRTTMLEDVARLPRLAQALWWLSLVDTGILRAWLTNNGQRPSDRRAAHLFCELAMRAKMIGLAQGGSFELPVSQALLGEALSITAVHANRTLRTLRELGLVEFTHGTVVVPDIDRLAAFAEFDPGYLQLDRRD